MRLFLIGIFCLLFSSVQGQEYWTKKSQNSVFQTKRNADKLPNKYQIFELQTDLFKNLARESPMRGLNSSESSVELLFPMSDGTFKAFKVMEAPVLDQELSDKFPNIKSYAGQGIEDPSEIMRFSISHKGLKGMLFSSNGYEFIEPYTEDFSHYMVYKRDDRHEGHSPLECSVTKSAKNKIENERRDNADDGTLRNFRLAVSTNGEYTQYHGGTVADALAAINTSMTRVNGIFEIDFNVTMTLIAETIDVIYTDANSDPYSNSSNSWNSQLQSTLTSEIGEANYDVGHLFAQGGNSGNAGCIGCVCVNNDKGSGWTSRSIPEGDPFDVDYVAHEIGHQFGGNHTWTHGGNEGTNVQMEPGSGSTIMGYAGITGNTDVQDNSDPYFHAVSIEQITDYVKSTNCQIDIITGNAVPVVDAGLDKSIPIGTPFTLIGAATDADGDALTYCWEQMDENNANTTYPSTTATTGIAFRSFNPTVSPQRTFPAMETVISGSTATTWEAVPDVGRTLNFRLTARDNVAGGGTNESDNLVVTVDGGSGPFTVTSQNTAQSYIETQTVAVTWDVANTDVAPVSCSDVDILLSYDGGLTYPVTLLSNTSNDGSADITFPTGTTTTGRIMVQCSDNYFFDINDTDFVIDVGQPTYNIVANPSVDEICQNVDSYIVNVESESISGFTTPINISPQIIPPGVSWSIANNPLTPGQSTTITLTGLSGNSGLQSIVFKSSAGQEAKSFNLNLDITSPPLSSSLTMPSNGAINVSVTPTLSWSEVSNASSYLYELSTISGAANVLNGSITTNTLDITSDLDEATDYYWRVKSINGCAESAWSAEFTFRTRSCITYSPTDLPINISASGTPTINSNIQIRDRGTIDDVQVLNLGGDHTWVRDLRFTVSSPTEASVIIWNRPCNNGDDDFDINFDDSASSGHTNNDCPPTQGLTYQPDNPLSGLDGSNLKGEWTMTVEDVFNQDGGSLNSYQLRLCSDDYCDLTVTKDIFSTASSISEAISCAVDGDTIWLETTIPTNTIDIEENTIIIDKSITIVGDVRTEILSSGSQPTFTISVGKSVSFIAIDIKNENGIGIENNGLLTLEDVNIETPNMTNQVQNSSTGEIILVGICNLDIE